MKCLDPSSIRIRSRIVEIHGISDPAGMEEIRNAQAAGDSVGGIVEIVASGCPPGLGDPVFGKLDARIAGAMMGIGAVKGVEIGEGFNAARLFGSGNNDPITPGGSLRTMPAASSAGISTGADIVARIAVKPTPSSGNLRQPSISTGRNAPYPSPGGTIPVLSPASCRSRRRCSPSLSSTACWKTGNAAILCRMRKRMM